SQTGIIIPNRNHHPKPESFLRRPHKQQGDHFAFGTIPPAWRWNVIAFFPGLSGVAVPSVDGANSNLSVSPVAQNQPLNCLPFDLWPSPSYQIWTLPGVAWMWPTRGLPLACVIR